MWEKLPGSTIRSGQNSKRPKLLITKRGARSCGPPFFGASVIKAQGTGLAVEAFIAAHFPYALNLSPCALNLFFGG